MLIQRGESGLYFPTPGIQVARVMPGGLPAEGITSGILDNFNRTDEGPPLSSSWTTFLGTGLKVISNEAAPNAAADQFEYYNPSTYGADCEAYVTVATKPATNDDYIVIGARLQDIGNYDGYYVIFQTKAGDDLWLIRRIDNLVPTTLGASFTQEVSDGDSIGIQIIGSTIGAWYRASGGSWTELTTRSDATYSAAGNLFLGMGNAATGQRADDFGGGTI